MKQKLAVIGTGIAGLGSAYFLSRDYDLTVFEKADYIGGHTHTVDVPEDGKQIPIDTGFIVFNHVTYPNLLRLFQVLNVPTKKSDMSFSVQFDPTKLEFCGSGLNGLFAQRSNFFKPKFIKMLLEIDRFNKTAPSILEDPEYDDWDLGKYMKENKYGEDILNYYLIPMSSAVWTTPPDLMLSFPAKSLIRFFYNHGFLGLNTQHQWWTVDGGSREYVKRITAGYSDRIRLNSSVKQVLREDGKVRVVLEDGSSEVFDKAVLATHGHISAKLLGNPEPLERELLPLFAYQKNTATLHTDASDMPRKKLCWSSWNYKIIRNDSGKDLPYTIYWMNRLQRVSDKKNYFVTINDPGRVRKEHILKEIEYEHPLFSVPSSLAQSRLPLLNETGPIYYAGAYFRYGFHEDGFLSAVNVSRSILKRDPWS
ncbi:NAD(P)/FAD-dependent oxidoreductase [Leptospira idonii]|uniref:NADP transhydrogenase subunit alpha n=1 Tax=Leptospira idonii TaxID=1193500 RepID=A0A4R9M1C3_9LEPT|nr:FAD-dependent oxidoreductase [Leptospira idonii]TGN19625.1 NADP transhydrogenase subunit alpha [Leptospira idonii]